MLLITCLLIPQQIARDPRYPAHWWTPVSEVGKPDWEILPQEAGPGEVILSKRNELGLLSNFAATPFTYRGKRYASVEGFWQMMLYPDGPKDPRTRATWKCTREQVAQMTAFEAKSAGTLAEANMKQLGIDWVTFEGKRFPYRSASKGRHYKLIVDAMWAKVRQNPEVEKVLLSTGDLILKPDHHGEQNPPPEWLYYKIWMQIRSALVKKGDIDKSPLASYSLTKLIQRRATQPDGKRVPFVYGKANLSHLASNRSFSSRNHD